MVVSTSLYYNSSGLIRFQWLLLSIKAELENVTNLIPLDDDFQYFFQVVHRVASSLSF